MGSGGEDIMLSPAARKKFPFSVECKNTKSFPSLEALRQAEYNSKGYTPIVCWKPPRKGFDDTLVYMKLGSFLKLWRNTIEQTDVESDQEESEKDQGIEAGEPQASMDDLP